MKKIFCSLVFLFLLSFLFLNAQTRTIKIYRPSFVRVPAMRPMPMPIYQSRTIYLPAANHSFNNRYQDYSSNRNSDLGSVLSRLASLERQVAEIKNKISGLSPQSSFSDERYQKLLKVERDMENLKGILSEVNYQLKNRR